MADILSLSVYNHYLTSYASKGTTSFDTHKKSELRNIYNSIVKLNKESPLYLPNTSSESKIFAIDLKEDARQLQNTLASLGGLDEAALLKKKEAFSSDESIASVSYIGDREAAADAPTLSLEVHSLASPQVNMGNFIPADLPVDLKPETYSFDLGINDLNYEFQFEVRDTDTNLDIQNRLTRLINNANIGLKAEIVNDNEGNASLKLTSQKSGISSDGDPIFHISDGETSKTSGIVEYLGIDAITRVPSNAEFTVDGVPYSEPSNTFAFDKNYRINLRGLTPEDGTPVDIGMKTDIESLTANLRQLAGGYNHFLRSAMEYTQKHPKSNQLVSEMWHLAGSFAEPLSDIGMNVGENGTIEIDENLLQQSVLEGNIEKDFNQIKDFTKALFRKSSQVSLNPMSYVENTVVSYKNPGRNYASPYITSAYSGMLFNSYC